MKGLTGNICLLLTGVLVGWWLHDLSGTPAQQPLITQTPNPRPAIASVSDKPAAVHAEYPAFPPRAESSAAPSPGEFRQLLERQAFKRALAYYENALRIDGAYEQLLRPVFESYLQDCQRQCSEGAFVELAQLWLENDYADIPVLLLLAEHQRLNGLPEEAATTLQLAAAYAWQAGQQENINSAVQHLVEQTDARLSKQQHWIELLGFYEYLHTIDLGTEVFQLRQAQLYQRVGEPQRSRELLLALLQEDTGFDAQWTDILNRYLAQSAPETTTPEHSSQATPITPHGDHFLVTATLNAVDAMALVIDTGASITSLSSEAFARSNRAKFQYRGSRLFNTANGLTQGEVYRTDSITLGGMRINDLDIAVLDYQPSPGVDGLLGMNVLRNYRFEIDQDRGLLHLSPRGQPEGS